MSALFTHADMYRMADEDSDPANADQMRKYAAMCAVRTELADRLIGYSSALVIASIFGCSLVIEYGEIAARWLS